jgi:O-antigen ligase
MNIDTELISGRSLASEAWQQTWLAALRLLHVAIAAPSLLFLAALAVMLFRPPDLAFYHLDRTAFVMLMVVVSLRVLAVRQPPRLLRSVIWPMFGLFLLALLGVLGEPYVPEHWSVFAAKWVVPFAFYHLAELVFDNDASLRQFETFCLVVLGYLCFIAIAFLIGTKSLIFPPYILNANLGIHADRARGPFLQAVANGVTLNILGLVALNAFCRGRLRGAAALLFAAALPLAVLATKTRAVWLSFAASVLILLLFSSSTRVRRACACLAVAGSLGLLAVLTSGNITNSLRDRAEEQGPLDFRISLYRAGWNMFLEKPVLGWGVGSTEAGLATRMNDFHQESFVFHNSYLEVVVEHGLVGLALYLWILADLFRLAFRVPSHIAGRQSFLDSEFRCLWPVIVAVYVLNACFVVMNYQFVNGLLFAMAGMLSAENRRISIC